MNRKLIIGFAAAILLISLLPLPQRINKTFYGVNTENGETVDIDLDLKYLRFLFLKDKMYAAVDVKTKEKTFSYGKFLHYTGKTRAYDFSGWYYNEEMYTRELKNGEVSVAPIGMEPLLMHISTDFSKILIFHSTFEKVNPQGRARYVGSTGQAQSEEAKEYFSGYYD